MHHPDKVDAPSGTATRTAEVIAAARARCRVGRAARRHHHRSRRRPRREVDGIPVHAVRARGFVACQEVVLGGVGETFSIRHDSPRPRVVHARCRRGAALRSPDRTGLTVGLDEVLGLE